MSVGFEVRTTADRMQWTVYSHGEWCGTYESMEDAVARDGLLMVSDYRLADRRDYDWGPGPGWFDGSSFRTRKAGRWT